LDKPSNVIGDHPVLDALSDFESGGFAFISEMLLGMQDIGHNVYWGCIIDSFNKTRFSMRSCRYSPDVLTKSTPMAAQTPSANAAKNIHEKESLGSGTVQLSSLTNFWSVWSAAMSFGLALWAASSFNKSESDIKLVCVAIEDECWQMDLIFW